MVVFGTQEGQMKQLDLYDQFFTISLVCCIHTNVLLLPCYGHNSDLYAKEEDHSLYLRGAAF